jgi:8-amino-3,8-dideoxy-alpha-D-manno-octulosonate transaminase
MKAVSQVEGRGEPKIGIEEFMSIAERFGLSEKSLTKIRMTLEEEEIGEGPFLANYYSGLAETKVQAYEREARSLFGSSYAIGTSSGTGALHAAFVAAGVCGGTEVICPAIGFMATAAAVVQARGVPVFCDVDYSLGMDPDKIEALITERTVAIAPTHVMGSLCDMDKIMRVASKHGLKVIEDVAQSCGGLCGGRFAGTIGDIGIFSISAYKIVGGGEGGLLLTSDKRLWERASQLIETGGLWRPDRFAPPRYEGELFAGTNYRMSELEAAVDVVQLSRVSATADRFRTVKRKVLEGLRSFQEITPQVLNYPDGEVGYLLRFFPESVELAEKLTAELTARGLEAGTRGANAGPDWHHYSYMYPIITKTGAEGDGCPFTCSRYLDRGGSIEYARGDCPVSDDLFDRMVSVKLNQWLTKADCEVVSGVLNQTFENHCSETTATHPWIQMRDES